MSISLLLFKLRQALCEYNVACFPGFSQFVGTGTESLAIGKIAQFWYSLGKV